MAVPEWPQHELCSLFPPMSPDQYAQLRASIADHGVLEPIVLFEGAVLDGWHRACICAELGIVPPISEYRGQSGNALDFVLDRNQNRRDLTIAQRAGIAADVQKTFAPKYRARMIEMGREGGKESGRVRRGDEPEIGTDVNDETFVAEGFGKIAKPFAGDDAGSDDSLQPGDARRDAAKLMGVSSRYVGEAERIRQASPETFEALKRGEKTIPEAKRELGLAKPKIPKAVVPDAVEESRREHAERRAIEEDVSDDEWIGRLPLASALSGVSLDKFRRDALDYRDYEATARRHDRDCLQRCKRRSGKRRRFEGVVSYRLMSMLTIEHPKDWRACPPPDKDGCGGAGTLPMIGDCPLCRGRGYLVK